MADGYKIVDGVKVYDNSYFYDADGKFLAGRAKDIRDGKVEVNRSVIREQLAKSLDTLGTDCIDLYLMHRDDPNTPVEEYIETLNEAQQAEALASREAYQAALSAAGRGAITTEIEPAGPYYFAEGYHQGYLAKNPAGYCGIGGTGVVCPIGLGVGA